MPVISLRKLTISKQVYNIYVFFIRNFEWTYLSFRFTVGIWVGIILLLGVATDASALVQYITRFTEENFALLIAIIFIKSAFEKVITVGKEFPVLPGTPNDCFCAPSNLTENEMFGTKNDFVAENQTYSYNKYKCSVNIIMQIDP